MLRGVLGVVQRRKKTSILVVAVILVCVLGALHLEYPISRYPIPSFGSAPSKPPAYIESIEPDGSISLREDDGYTRLIAGVDGFYVFENVYVKDRTLFMVQAPGSVPFPSLNKIITSSLSDSYDSSTFLSRLQSRPSSSSAIYKPKSPKYDAQVAGSNADNDDFPQVPRLWVLQEEEARTIIPSFFPAGTSAGGMAGSWWPGSWWGGEGDIAKRGLGTFRKLWDFGGAGDEVKVLSGVTFFWADDPAIMGWGALMHHYFHFVGELLLGSYHAYISSLSPTSSNSATWSDERRRSPADYEEVEKVALKAPAFRPGLEDPPARVVIPWSNNWKGLELQEMVLEGAFGSPDIVDRDTWRNLNSDHRWRKFEKVVITDRHAAHNDPMSQVSAWNKMALDSLESPLPPYDPPSNFLSLPQKLLGEFLELPERPAHRPGTEDGWEAGKSLEEGVVRVLYVDRQGSDRKFDDESHEGMMDVLKWLEMRKLGKGKGKKKGKVVVKKAKFEEMGMKEQIAAAWDADVVVGIHGNGLTHLVWVKSGATIVEIFPKGTFIRDYEVLSTALNHNYMTVWHDEIFTQDRWLDEKHGPEAERLHDGTLITVDSQFMLNLLDEVVSNMAH